MPSPRTFLILPCIAALAAIVLPHHLDRGTKVTPTDDLVAYLNGEPTWTEAFGEPADKPEAPRVNPFAVSVGIGYGVVSGSADVAVAARRWQDMHRQANRGTDSSSTGKKKKMNRTSHRGSAASVGRSRGVHQSRSVFERSRQYSRLQKDEVRRERDRRTLISRSRIAPRRPIHKTFGRKERTVFERSRHYDAHSSRYTTLKRRLNGVLRGNRVFGDR